MRRLTWLFLPGVLLLFVAAGCGSPPPTGDPPTSLKRGEINKDLDKKKGGENKPPPPPAP
jgi:hypothetical protein